MFIRSERLFLRPVWPEDWDELYPLIADEDIARNLARVPWPYTEQDAREFCARGQDPKLPGFTVTLPGAHGSRIVGQCGLGEHDGQIELGYWIAPEHWGKGYASEVARAVLCVAKVLGYSRIHAGHFVDNPASGRVLRKAGFLPTGRSRMRFSLGRGCEVASVEYAVDLDCLCGGDKDGGGDGPFDRMAA